MIADDRGRPIKLRFRGVPIFARVKGQGIERRHRFYEVGWFSPELAVALGLIGAGLLIWSGVFLNGLTWMRIAAGLVGVPLVVIGLVAVMSMLFMQRATPAMHAQVFAKRDRQGQCRACTFSLAGLAAEPDGCTVCPECGAAWRLPLNDA